MKIKGTQLFVKALKEEGVDTLFAYPGGMAIDIFDALYGETSFNKRGLMCGNINAHLTESGKLVALALGDKLSFVKFDAAFRSPMYRTEETISCILQKNPFPVAVTVDPRIRERDYGYLEGETHKTQPEFNMRWHIDYDADRLKMESLDSLFSRGK